MKVKCDVLLNILDSAHKVYLIPGMDPRVVDGAEFLPVFEDPKRLKLTWVRAYAYKKVDTEMVEIDA